MLQSGDTLAGYRIEAVAGVGGMGVVYRATQTSLDRPVALKVLSSTLVGNRTFRERFRREGRHAAALDHPNIIPVYEAGESNGLMFIAMRLVDGPSLADVIDRRELTGQDALRLLRAIGSALDTAHEAGLVHRDIKPQNMLLTRSGHPYLADFGITKGSDHGGLTHNGDFVGSLNYVAPEQIEGTDVAGASDIYALAAVLFQALTGAYPYERDNDAALMHAHLSAEPPTLSARGIHAPAALDAVFTRGMAKDPAARFPTAAALLDAAAAAVAGVPAAQLGRAPSFVPGSGSAGADGARRRSTPGRGAPADSEPAARPAPPLPSSVPDRTAADARRPSDLRRPTPPADERDAAGDDARRRVPAAALLALAAVLLVAAPVAGWLLGRTEDPPLPASVRSSAVSVSHGAEWTSGRAAIEGLALDTPVALRGPGGVKFVAGRLPDYAQGFDPLPQALRSRADGELQPAAVRIGDRQVVRYRGTLRSGDRLWVALAPDTRGWIAVGCEGPGADRASICGDVAATLRVAGAAAVVPGPDEATAEALAGALAALNTARGKARTKTELAAKGLRTRAAAAGALAGAHDDAADAVAAIEGRPQEAALLTVLARALREQATRLERVGGAARKRDTVAYRRARLAVRQQDDRLDAALRRLRAAGYGGA